MSNSVKKLTNASAVKAFLATLGAGVPGLPAQDSVVAITETPQFTIIHSQEEDRYDEGAEGLGLAGTAAPVAPVGDNYAGTDRKAAKLSIATAPTETFADVKGLIATLAPEAQMINHNPKINTTATSDRVQEEKRNIHVDAFIYAASRESDNDFHMIVGLAPNAGEEVYMTMELSGLPPQTAASFPQLNAARTSFKTFFSTQAGGTLPGSTYDFYQPPLGITIEGSLFFDMTHAKGSRPGPASLKGHMPVIWEVHPVSNIVFK